MVLTQKFAKTEKCYFQRLRTFVFYFKVAWKPFFKMFLKNNLWSKWPLRLYLAFPKKVVSTWSLRSLVFGLNIARKQFSKKLLMTNFGFKQFFNASRYILRKWFQLCHSKIYKKLKNTLSKVSAHSSFTSCVFLALKPFSEILTMINFGFKDLLTLCFAFAVSGFNFFTQI